MLKIKKIISLITLILISFPSFGGDIKLFCKINLETTYSTGTIEKTYEEELFEITETRGTIIILPNSRASKFSSISNHKHSTTISIKDRSDANKWDIAVSDKNPQGLIDEVSFMIDRNTGKIFYSLLSRQPAGAYLKELGYGNCEKVDMSKRKF
jgi:hypothetical protein